MSKYCRGSARDRLYAVIVLMLWPLAGLATAFEAEAVRGFVEEMVEQHQFEEDAVERLLGQARRLDNVLESMASPAEAKPWFTYRPNFVNEQRINAGVEFWKGNAKTLARTETIYGLPPEIIVSIIGVETFYGKWAGRYRVVDALATLGFNYPPRADFFRGELVQYLLMTREQEINPLSLKGSYAGAMGMPQFIPSSYRTYAVDFSKDGKANIWADTEDATEDAIGSVGNYLKQHGWQPGQEVAIPAKVWGDKYQAMLSKGLQPHTPWRKWNGLGVFPINYLKENPDAALIQLEQEEGFEYWLGLQNFYVITRYNHSPLYAMAVYQLAQAIKTRYLGNE